MKCEHEALCMVQFDLLPPSRTPKEGQTYFLSLALNNDKKTYMKTNTRPLIYIEKQRFGPVFL